jgi:hypothetical protein
MDLAYWAEYYTTVNSASSPSTLFSRPCRQRLQHWLELVPLSAFEFSGDANEGTISCVPTIICDKQIQSEMVKGQ